MVGGMVGGVGATFEYRDEGLGKLTRDLAQLKKLKLRVGYQGESAKATHPGSEITVAKMAAIMEFGSPGAGIPERSFMRSVIDAKQAEIAGELERQISKLVLGKASPVEALSHVGRLTTKLIRDKLLSAGSWAESLDASTAAEKGHGRPLFDTGTLARALTWRVSQGRQTFARGT